MGNNFLEHSKTIRVDLKKLQAVQVDSNSCKMLQDYLNEKKKNSNSNLLGTSPNRLCSFEFSEAIFPVTWKVLFSMHWTMSVDYIFRRIAWLAFFLRPMKSPKSAHNYRSRNFISSGRVGWKHPNFHPLFEFAFPERKKKVWKSRGVTIYEPFYSRVRGSRSHCFIKFNNLFKVSVINPHSNH